MFRLCGCFSFFIPFFLTDGVLCLQLCGTPGPDNWEGFDKLPAAKFVMPAESYPRSVQKRFRKMYVFLAYLIVVSFSTNFSFFSCRFRAQCDLGINLVDAILALDPKKRPRAADLLDHDFFWKDPMPAQPHEYGLCCGGVI